MKPGAKVFWKQETSFLLLFVKGACMGAADLVPGVSGGTMALILGIYARLVGSIRNLSRKCFWKDLLRLRLQAAFSSVDGPFLVVLLGGMLTSVLALARPIEAALMEYPAYIWSFFFGLVLASALLLGKRVTSWNYKLAVASLGAAGTAFWLVDLAPSHTPETWWFVLVTGALALCAMLLPGISGSYILVLLGKYHFILGALNQWDFVNLLLFMTGGVVGLLSFARGLIWLLARFANFVFAALSGLLLGSLRKIWPWQNSFLEEENAGLNLYYVPRIDLDPFPWEFAAAIALFLLGLGFVLAMSRLDKKSNTTQVESAGFTGL